MSPDPLAPLPRSFYARPVLQVARSVVGKVLVRRLSSGEELRARVVEVEAYRGPEDRAAHSYAGRRTKRTEVMYGPPGHAYVFILYGMHWHLNLVTGHAGQPQAVLIRAAEPLLGAQTMARLRAVDPQSADLTNGPGKLCQALAIGRQEYGHDLTRAPLYLAEGSGKRPRVARSARIGVEYAGEWAARPWRFFDPNSRHVSRARPSG